MQAINCQPGTKIYIFCPAGNATGGPEALHQLGYHLNKLGFNAFMFYYSTPDSNGIVHESYKKYQVPYMAQIENKRQHVIIMPETYLFPIFKTKFNLIRKVIWWLSVVNYYKTQKAGINSDNAKRFLNLRRPLWANKKPSFDRLKQLGVISIGHSYYSMVHLRENGIEPIGQISDYMNSTFFEFAKVKAEKENIIIYNPRKNDDFLEEIKSRTAKLTWVPLIDMTPQQVADWMNRAKLYVDFGYHPGKERMPRESCIMRCCMIIGKTGSAAYEEDMPIPEKYRYEKSKDQVPNIIERIMDCLTDYEELIDDFKPYRETLYHEEEKFIEDIKKIFVKVSA